MITFEKEGKKARAKITYSLKLFTYMFLKTHVEERYKSSFINN